MSDGTAEAGKKRRPPLKTFIIIAVVVIALVTTTLFFYHFNGDSLDFSNRTILTVPTGSMDGEPQDYPISTIPKDSIIMVHLLSDEQKKDLVKGDVITFRQDGIEKVHRIITDIGPDGTLTTQGDANPTPDAQITLDDVDGKVVGVAPNVGKAVSAIRDFTLNSPILMIIGIILLIILVYSVIEIIGIMREKPTDDDDKNPPNQ